MEKKNKKQERRQQKEKNHFMVEVEKLGNHTHVLNANASIPNWFPRKVISYSCSSLPLIGTRSPDI